MSGDVIIFTEKVLPIDG